MVYWYCIQKMWNGNNLGRREPNIRLMSRRCRSQPQPIVTPAEWRWVESMPLLCLSFYKERWIVWRWMGCPAPGRWSKKGEDLRGWAWAARSVNANAIALCVCLEVVLGRVTLAAIPRCYNKHARWPSLVSLWLWWCLIDVPPSSKLVTKGNARNEVMLSFLCFCLPWLIICSSFFFALWFCMYVC